MKAYRARLTYWTSKEDNNEDNLVTWLSDETYPVEQQAQSVADQMAKLTATQFKVNSVGIVDIEFPDTLIMEGFVEDNGCHYEDYALTIKNGKAYKFIESEIGNRYKGRNVRITVELLD